MSQAGIPRRGSLTAWANSDSSKCAGRRRTCSLLHALSMHEVPALPPSQRAAGPQTRQLAPLLGGRVRPRESSVMALRLVPTRDPRWRCCSPASTPARPPPTPPPRSRCRTPPPERCGQRAPTPAADTGSGAAGQGHVVERLVSLMPTLLPSCQLRNHTTRHKGAELHVLPTRVASTTL